VEVTGKFFDIFTGTTAVAVLGADGTDASLAFVAVEAAANASLAVAEAFVAAFSVVVSLVGAIGGVGPSKAPWTGAEGAVGCLPVLMARTLVVGAADTIPGTMIRTYGCDVCCREDEQAVTLHHSY
jgi:hypothetical protein